jgi:hypothetical protein
MLTQKVTFTNQYTVNNAVTTMIQILDRSKMTDKEYAEKFIGVISPEDSPNAKRYYVVSLTTSFHASNTSVPAISPTFDAYFGSYDTVAEATAAVHAITASLAPDFCVATRNLARHKAEERRQARTFELMRYNSKCLKDLRDKNVTTAARQEETAAMECQGSAKKKPRTDDA